MGQASAKLRRGTNGYFWFCPGCQEMHPLPDSWTFDGNLDAPTFSPSFKHSGMQKWLDKGQWTGEWVRDAKGNTVPFVCHYIVTAGQVQFCGDSTHALAGQTVAMPDLPPEHQD